MILLRFIGVPLNSAASVVLVVSLLISLCVCTLEVPLLGACLMGMGSSLNRMFSLIRLKWVISFLVLPYFLVQNLCSKTALITSTIRVTMVELVPKIVFSLLFLDSCFKWNFLLTSTMSIGFLVLSCSPSISFRNSVSSYSCTLIRSLRCKFRLFCLRMMLSSISTPDVNTCWFRLERHPGVRLIMLKPSIRIFSCLLPWQFMKRSV